MTYGLKNDDQPWARSLRRWQVRQRSRISTREEAQRAPGP